MQVRLVDLARLHAPIRRDLDAAIARVVDSGRFVLGAEVDSFEREIAAELGVAHAIAVSSGSDALLACMWADGVGAGDEVITPAFSFGATAEAIVRLGATVVFADVGDDLNLDAKDALARVTDRTRAILAVDLFGRRADFDAMGSRAALFEDAAQAIGCAGVATGVRAAAISFFPTKNLGALGDGGLVATNDATLAEAVRDLRAHGATKKKYVHERVGWNMRLDALQAAVLRVKLPHLREWNEKRVHVAARYLDALRDLPIDLPPPSRAHVWHHFVIGTDDRDAVRASLAGRGVETEVYYPVALHELPCFSPHGVPRLPRAERAAKRALALPIHPMLEPDEVDWVIDGVRAALSAR